MQKVDLRVKNTEHAKADKNVSYKHIPECTCDDLLKFTYLQVFFVSTYMKGQMEVRAGGNLSENPAAIEAFGLNPCMLRDTLTFPLYGPRWLFKNKIANAVFSY